MSVTVILAIATFTGLFTAWVILPSFLRKRHAKRANKQSLLGSRTNSPSLCCR